MTVKKRRFRRIRSAVSISRLVRHPEYLRPIVRWYGVVLRQRIARRLRPQTSHEFAMRFMSTPTPHSPAVASDVADQSSAPAMPPKSRFLLLIRHGQATFNTEGRHPGQLPGVPLTDEGRRQAHRAAVALSALPLSTIISSPLERAAETAEIIARGWGLPVRTDPRLMDTNVGHWAGQKIEDIAKNDPAWKVFVANPDNPPPGVESFSSVQARAVALVTEALADPANGDYIVMVAHGDVVRLIMAQYMKTPIQSVPFLSIGNASISALAFTGDGPPQVLAINWTADPRWLVASPLPVPAPTAPTVPNAEATGPQQAAPTTENGHDLSTNASNGA